MIKDLRIYVQKILPLVYDDTLSYYELLNKVVVKLNEVIGVTNDVAQTIETDVSSILNEWLDNGTFDDIINENIFNELNEQITELDGEIDSVNTRVTNVSNSINPFLLKDKKCVFLGDSLTWGDVGDSSHSQASKPFPTIIEEITGCTSYNYGRKSARMSNYEQSNSNTLQNQLINADLSNADYVFIEFFTNDCSGRVPLGDIDSTDWNMYSGALNNAIEYINTATPLAEIIVLGITPSNRYFNHVYNGYRTLIDSYDMVMRKVCNNKNVKYINLLDCGIDKNNFSSYSSDGTHFNQAGYYKLAYCILNNIGGNSKFVDEGENKFNNFLYPFDDEIGKYKVLENGEQTMLNSFSDVTFERGVYRIKCKYTANVDSYNTGEYYVGFHLRSGNNFLVSPIGIVNGSGKIDAYFYVEETVTGLVNLRSVSSGSDVFNFTDLSLYDLEIIPITGKISYPLAFTSANDLTGFEGTVNILRTKDGLIRVEGNGTITEDIAAYTPFFSNIALRKIRNRPNSPINYFPIHITSSSSCRGQLQSTGICAGVAINSGSVIAFSFVV